MVCISADQRKAKYPQSPKYGNMRGRGRVLIVANGFKLDKPAQSGGITARAYRYGRRTAMRNAHERNNMVAPASPAYRFAHLS
jgi:hypothetical protein